MVAFIHWKHYVSCCHFGLCLTLTELPVLGDHLAVAAVALTGIGAVAVYTAALPFTRVLVTLVHICDGRRRKKVKAEDREGEYERSNTTLHCSSRLYTFQALTLELLCCAGIPQ